MEELFVEGRAGGLPSSSKLVSRALGLVWFSSLLLSQSETLMAGDALCLRGLAPSNESGSWGIFPLDEAEVLGSLRLLGENRRRKFFRNFAPLPPLTSPPLLQ